MDRLEREGTTFDAAYASCPDVRILKGELSDGPPCP